MQLTARFTQSLDRAWASPNTSGINRGMSSGLGELKKDQFSQLIGKYSSIGKQNTQSTKEDTLHVKIESMVMRSFVQEMLPKEETAIFGTGIAGGYWRSILADEIADAVARSGGLGIANQIMKNIDN